MAWTTPKTDFDPGNVLTAAEMNAIGENLVSLINVQSTTKTDTQSISLATATFSSNITGLDVTITPTSATSKILLIAMLSLSGESTVGVRLVRGATPIGVGATAGSRTSVSTGHEQNTVSTGLPTSIVFLDSPATISAQTYGLQVFNGSGVTRNIYINRGSTDTDTATHMRTISSVTAIEIPV